MGIILFRCSQITKFILHYDIYPCRLIKLYFVLDNTKIAKIVETLPILPLSTIHVSYTNCQYIPKYSKNKTILQALIKNLLPSLIDKSVSTYSKFLLLRNIYMLITIQNKVLKKKETISSALTPIIYSFIKDVMQSITINIIGRNKKNPSFTFFIA